MTAQALPTPLPLPRSGVAGVTRLSGAADLFAVGDLPDLVDAELALELGIGEILGLPPAPGLRVVGGPPSPVKAWAARFAQALVEVMAGDRNPHQLLRCTSRDVHLRICERSAALNAVGPPQQRRRPLRAQVRSVHCFQVDPTTAEASVHVRHGERSRALAARIEWIEGRWLCVALEFG